MEDREGGSETETKSKRRLMGKMGRKEREAVNKTDEIVIIKTDKPRD